MNKAVTKGVIEYNDGTSRELDRGLVITISEDGESVNSNVDLLGLTIKEMILALTALEEVILANLTEEFGSRDDAKDLLAKVRDAIECKE